MNTTIEGADDITEAILIPIWLEIASGLLYLGSIITVIVIAHFIVSRRGKGGYSLLISVYLAILLSIALLPLSFFFDSSSYSLNVLIGLSYFGSNVFIFMATIHALRYVLWTARNKEF